MQTSTAPRSQDWRVGTAKWPTRPRKVCTDLLLRPLGPQTKGSGTGIMKTAPNGETTEYLLCWKARNYSDQLTAESTVMSSLPLPLREPSHFIFVFMWVKRCIRARQSPSSNISNTSTVTMEISWVFQETWELLIYCVNEFRASLQN